MQTSVLLSIKPEFAEAILEGTKKFEFRRKVFRKPEVGIIVVYASTPICRVIGEFRLAGILTMSPSALWAATCSAAGIDRRYFDNYFAGREEAYALKVKNPRKYKVPLDLRTHFGVDRPPQSFCYLKAISLPD